MQPREPLSDQCNAPGCQSPVEVVVRGVDYDGQSFVERVCGSCGIYLLEGGGELVPIASDEEHQR